MPSLASVNLFVQDIQRSTVFYREVLGLELDAERSVAAMVLLVNPGCKLGLQSAGSLGRKVTSSDGVELGFEVDDVDEVWNRFRESEGKVMSEPVEQGFGRTFDARDPDGYHLTIYKLRD